MTPEAARTWEKVYRALPDEAVGIMGEITARAAPHIIRLAVIFAVLDGSSDVDLAHLKAAIAVWNYCEESARQIFGDRAGTRKPTPSSAL